MTEKRNNAGTKGANELDLIQFNNEIKRKNRRKKHREKVSYCEKSQTFWT